VTHCDIVIPVWNQLEATKACLESIIENTDYPYRVIIVDNKSDEPTASFLRSFSEQHSEKVLLIRSQENLGYIRGTNLGMKASTGGYVCLLNNDTVVYPAWLSAMIEVAGLEGDIGLVNPASNHFGINAEDNSRLSGSLYSGMGVCIGFCMLIKRDVIEKIGFLDERFGMGYGEDDAYSIYAHNAGYRCAMAKRAYVYHYGKRSFGKNKKAKAYREKQRMLAKELLGERLKITAFLSGDLTSANGDFILGLFRKLADKGVRCRIFWRQPLEKLLYEHTFVTFRKKKFNFYLSAIYRFVWDHRVKYFATDSMKLFNLLNNLNFIIRKRLFFLGDKIYSADGPVGGYEDDARSVFFPHRKSYPGQNVLKIAVITPKQKEDYLANTILDGLMSLHRDRKDLEFFISSKYPASRIHLGKDFVLSRKEFISFAREADIIFLMWGKKNTDYELAKEIGEWGKTIFIDGSELGGNKRLDKDIEKQVLNLTYKGVGAIDYEMLDKCSLYFRREKPYIKGISPLPFGIESTYTKHYDVNKKKDIDFTCVFGQEECPPLRRQVRERLEKFCKEHRFSCHTSRTKDPDEFYEILSRTKVGISVSGGGFDTARFWEILGNNCILLTEKIDIFRPEDNAFDYKRIWQFEDIQEFESKLKEIAHFLRNGYNQDTLDREFKEILPRHSSNARVLTIFNEAKEI
jgi:GT2 family glycosyltransferase